MKIYKKKSFHVPAFIALVTCAQFTFGTADDLISQVSQNPLQLDNHKNPQRLPAGFSNAPPGSSFDTRPVFAPVSNPVPQYTAKQDLADIIADNVLQFGHIVGHYLNEMNSNAIKSEIFSPLSVISALSLLSLGAKGKSYQELRHILGYDLATELASNPGKYHEEFGAMLDDVQHFASNNANGNRPQRQHAKWRDTELKGPKPGHSVHPNAVVHTINVANGIFLQSGYSANPDYIQVVKSIYDSEITQLDFQRQSADARNYINNWVNDKTQGKIPTIIVDDIDKSTNVILASVLYFKAFWETPFFPRSTKDDQFYPDGVQGAAIPAKMMATGGGFPFYDAVEYDCRIIGLPYRGNETTMYVIQPNDSSRQKLRNLLSILNAQKINQMIDNMSLKTTIMVFPKMHFTRSVNMKTILQTMGVKDVFQSGFSDLSLLGAPRRGAVAVPLLQLADERAQSVFGQGIVNNAAQPPQKSQFLDRYHEPALRVTSRFGEVEGEDGNENEKSTSEDDQSPSDNENTLKKAHNLNKRQVKGNSSNAHGAGPALAKLENDRSKTDSYGSDLYVGDILHKVDVTVDEYGTEAAAATLSYLLKSGTEVVFRADTPFMVLIRHDPTKLPLFYGIINKPEL